MNDTFKNKKNRDQALDPGSFQPFFLVPCPFRDAANSELFFYNWRYTNSWRRFRSSKLSAQFTLDAKAKIFRVWIGVSIRFYKTLPMNNEDFKPNTFINLKHLNI